MVCEAAVSALCRFSGRQGRRVEGTIQRGVALRAGGAVLKVSEPGPGGAEAERVVPDREGAGQDGEREAEEAGVPDGAVRGARRRLQEEPDGEEAGEGAHGVAGARFARGDVDGASWPERCGAVPRHREVDELTDQAVEVVPAVQVGQGQTEAHQSHAEAPHGELDEEEIEGEAAVAQRVAEGERPAAAAVLSRRDRDRAAGQAQDVGAAEDQRELVPLQQVRGEPIGDSVRQR